MRIVVYISRADYADEVNRKVADTLLQALGEDAELRHAASLKGDRPRLVHVFGCWNRDAASMVSKAHRQRIPTLYSPLGGLMPWNIDNHKGEKEIKTLQYQRRMTATANALHAFSPLEERQLRRLAWNNNIEMIGNPFTTSQLTAAEMADRMTALYKKTLDTFPNLQLPAAALRIVGDILQAAIDKDSWHEEARKKSLERTLGELTDEDWHYIWLYSADELITPLMRKGIATLKLQVPSMQPAAVDRFPSSRKYNEATLTIDGDDAARALAKTLQDARKETARGAMPLSHLADIYRLLRYTDYDEDAFTDAIRKHHMQKFVARLLAVEYEVMHLTEGFMPITPIADKAARRLLHRITKIQ